MIPSRKSDPLLMTRKFLHWKSVFHSIDSPGLSEVRSVILGYCSLSADSTSSVPCFSQWFVTASSSDYSSFSALAPMRISLKNNLVFYRRVLASLNQENGGRIPNPSALLGERVAACGCLSAHSLLTVCCLLIIYSLWLHVQVRVSKGY